MLKKAIPAVMITLYLSGCSFAPVVAQKMGIGTVKEEEIADATAKIFGVSQSSVSISEIQKDDGFNGTKVYYSAKISGKPYRCFMMSSFAGSSQPKCVKPGEPLNAG